MVNHNYRTQVPSVKPGGGVVCNKWIWCYLLQIEKVLLSSKKSVRIWRVIKVSPNGNRVSINTAVRDGDETIHTLAGKVVICSSLRQERMNQQYETKYVLYRFNLSSQPKFPLLLATDLSTYHPFLQSTWIPAPHVSNRFLNIIFFFFAIV